MEREPPLDIRTLPREMLISYQNGLELNRDLRVNKGYTERSESYEEKCFRIITEDASGWLIGPRLIDYLLHNTFLGTETRPDAIAFSETTPDQWILTELYEFKSGKQSGKRRKIDGLSALLVKLRDRPYYFAHRLEVVLGDYIPALSDIVIPENSRIRFTMVRPGGYERQWQPTSKTDFIFRRLVIPLD